MPGINRRGGWHLPGLTDHNHLRHLLQVGFADRELGRILRRMRRTKIFDDALLIVVADHGYSFDLGVASRRLVTDGTVEEVAPVPFFVKLPGQTEGQADDSLVRTIDVVPTIAEVLGTEVYWRNDGHSAFSDETRDREEVALERRDFSGTVTIAREELEAAREQVRRRRAAKFGTGAESRRAFGDPWASAYRIGPNQDLLGRRVPRGRATRSDALRARVANSALLEDVDRTASLLPTRVAGHIEGGAAGEVRDLALVLNGRVAAVGESFRLRGHAREFFSLMVPGSALRDGRNSVQLLEVRADGSLVSLS